MIKYFFIILLVSYFPLFFQKFFILEKGSDKGEAVLRWSCWLFLLALLSFNICSSEEPFIIKITTWAFIVFLLCELTSRLIVLLLSRFFSFINNDFRILGRRVYECSALEGMQEPSIEAHPFLQFTHRRNKDLAANDWNIGFKNYKLSDIPKPPRVIRIACIGGSTTASGYPEILNDVLKESCGQSEFQVFNFGQEWWSSMQTAVNFILNVVDFKPDYVIFHNNCNDHNYRGYEGIRGDASHAYLPIDIPQDKDISLYRFSVIYRVAKKYLMNNFPSLKRKLGMDSLALKPGKSYRYDPREEKIFERNLRTIHAVARENNIKLMLMTMPYSNILKYSNIHDKVYRPHIRRYNDLMRKVASEKLLALIEAEPIITGEEFFFWDPVHLHYPGKAVKAVMAAEKIAEDLNLTLSLTERWSSLNDFINLKKKLLEGAIGRTLFDEKLNAAISKFPPQISIESIEKTVIQKYIRLLDEYDKIIFWGGGLHSRWLIGLLKKNKLRLPFMIFDENPKGNSILGVPVRNPQKKYLVEKTVIALSSDCIPHTLEKRSKELFPDIETAFFYEGFPPGPYPKNFFP